MWREPEDLPQDLVFNVNYLGGNMPTFALNFSRPGSQVIGQYYNFLRLGFLGYKADPAAVPQRGHVPVRRDRGDGAVRVAVATAASCRCSSSR